MAITLYNAVLGGTVAGTSVDTGSGPDRILLYIDKTAAGSDSITAVTIGGVSMTKIGSVQSGPNRFISAWKLVAPSITGSQTITVTGTDCCEQTFWAFTGCDTVVGTKSYTTEQGSTSGAVDLVITANNGDWLVGSAISDVGAVTVGANTTLRSAASSNIQADSNGVASPTALNFSLASAGNYALLGFAISPAAGDNLTLLGVS